MNVEIEVKYTVTFADNGIMVKTEEEGCDTTIEVIESNNGDTSAWTYLGKSVFEDILRCWESNLSERGNTVTMNTTIHVGE